MSVTCIQCRREKKTKHCWCFPTGALPIKDDFDFQKFGDKMTVEIDKWFEFFKEHTGSNNAATNQAKVEKY